MKSISTDLVNRLAADPKLSSYFANVTPKQRAQLAKYAADYTCKEAGDTCNPVRPNLRLVKDTPVLTQTQERAALSDLEQTLAAHRVPRDIRFEISRIVR